MLEFGRTGVQETETYKRRWRVPGRRWPLWGLPAKNTMSLNLVEGTG